MLRLDNRSLRILIFFLILTGLPLATLAWLAWEFLQQDRDLEVQRQREQLQSASELLVRDLQAQLQALERSLGEKESGSRITPGSGTFFRLQASRVIERSGVALPFYPVAKSPVDTRAAMFAPTERLEFIDGRCDLALRAYREFAASAHDDVRAGALMRLARCLRQLGRHGQALDIYQQLTTLGDTPIAGMPAELLARRERVALLVSRGDAAAARAEEQILRKALLEGQFTVDRGTFEFLVEPLGIADESIVHLPLALAAETWSPRWQGDGCGRLAGSVAGSTLLGLWCRNAHDEIRVIIIRAQDVLDRLRPSAQTMHVAAAVHDEAGNSMWGAIPAPAISVARHLSDVSLPWQLRVGSAEPAHAATIISRRRALAASGLAMMVVIVVAAAFFVFRAVNRELEIARLQTDFISTVSHEFRTPLTAMNHLTELLEESAVPAERVPQYYAALHRETKRLQRVVESLLDFRRFEAGRRAYRMEPMDAQETVRQVVDSYAARDDSRRLQVSLGAASATIRGDREAVAAAVSNLLDNALKYSPADAPVSIEVEPHGTMVGIAVQDRGAGITRDERRRVFRKFVRGAAAYDGNVKGTGIGLAIVDAVVKAHGGRVDLQTVPGQGSRFTLLLPRA